MFLTVLNRLPRLLNLCQRTDPVIVFRNVRIINGAIVLCHFQGAVSHKPPKAPSLSSGEIQRGPAGPLWSFQLGRFAGGEENEIFPSCVSFSLLPFFWTSKRKEDRPLTEESRENRILGKDEVMCCRADSNCHSA